MSLLISSTEAVEFERVYPQAGQDINEAWLQEHLFSYPSLLNHLPNCSNDPILPVCRELPLSGTTATVFLDIFAVRRSGRPVLVECKLWRNPQARREVIGQTLEYAAIVRGMSYSDLQAIVQRRLSSESENPIFSIVQDKYSDIRESEFVDTMQRHLAAGEFDLVVAGDGIRSDVLAISELLNARGAGPASLSLLDVQIYRNPRGDLFLNPTTVLKTEVLKRHVLVDGQGMLVESRQESEEDLLPDTDPNADLRKQADRAFWDRFIAAAHFDHPEQDQPRHGGRNYVRLPLPAPANSMVCYRARGLGVAGVFFRLQGEDGMQLFEQFEQQKLELEQQLGAPLNFSRSEQAPTISTTQQFDIDDESTQDDQLNWLTENANGMVNTFRPLIASD